MKSCVFKLSFMYHSFFQNLLFSVLTKHIKSNLEKIIYLLFHPFWLLNLGVVHVIYVLEISPPLLYFLIFYTHLVLHACDMWYFDLLHGLYNTRKCERHDFYTDGLYCCAFFFRNNHIDKLWITCINVLL